MANTSESPISKTVRGVKGGGLTENPRVSEVSGADPYRYSVKNSFDLTFGYAIAFSMINRFQKSKKNTTE